MPLTTYCRSVLLVGSGSLVLYVLEPNRGQVEFNCGVTDGRGKICTKVAQCEGRSWQGWEVEYITELREACDTRLVGTSGGWCHTE